MSKSPEGVPIPLPDEIIAGADLAEGERGETSARKPRKSSKKQTKVYSDAELLSQLDTDGLEAAGRAMDIAIEEEREEKANAKLRAKGFGSTEAGEAAFAEELRVEEEMVEKIKAHRSVPRKYKPKKYVPKKDLKKMTAEEFGEHVRTKNLEMITEEGGVEPELEVIVEAPKKKRRAAKSEETTVPFVMDAEVEELSTMTDAQEQEKELEKVRFNEALDIARARKQEIADRYEIEKIRRENIEAADSFDALFEALDTGKGLFGTEKENGDRDYFDTELLKSIITSVRNRELGDPADGEQQGIEYVTRSEGLRDKVFELIQNERKMTGDTNFPSVFELDDDEEDEEGVVTEEPITSPQKTAPLVPKKLVPPPHLQEPVSVSDPSVEKTSFDSELSEASVTELPEDTLSGKKLQFKEEGIKRKIKKKGVASVLTEANEMPRSIETQIRIAEQELATAQTEHAKIVAEVMDVRHRMANYDNKILAWFSRVTGSDERNKARYQVLVSKEKEVLAELQDMEDRIKALNEPVE
jgi:hypothetical protein